MLFTDIELKPSVLKALAEMGYETMTPIQEQTIPHIVADKDVMGLAETGSGKPARAPSRWSTPSIPQLRPSRS